VQKIAIAPSYVEKNNALRPLDPKIANLCKTYKLTIDDYKLIKQHYNMYLAANRRLTTQSKLFKDEATNLKTIPLAYTINQYEHGDFVNTYYYIPDLELIDILYDIFFDTMGQLKIILDNNQARVYKLFKLLSIQPVLLSNGIPSRRIITQKCFDSILKDQTTYFVALNVASMTNLLTYINVSKIKPSNLKLVRSRIAFSEHETIPIKAVNNKEIYIFYSKVGHSAYKLFHKRIISMDISLDTTVLNEQLYSKKCTIAHSYYLISLISHLVGEHSKLIKYFYICGREQAHQILYQQIQQAINLGRKSDSYTIFKKMLSLKVEPSQTKFDLEPLVMKYNVFKYIIFILQHTYFSYFSLTPNNTFKEQMKKHARYLDIELYLNNPLIVIIEDVLHQVLNDAIKQSLNLDLNMQRTALQERLLNAEGSQSYPALSSVMDNIDQNIRNGIIIQQMPQSTSLNFDIVLEAKSQYQYQVKQVDDQLSLTLLFLYIVQKTFNIQFCYTAKALPFNFFGSKVVQPNNFNLADPTHEFIFKNYEQYFQKWNYDPKTQVFSYQI
jgi:hypothetical protein